MKIKISILFLLLLTLGIASFAQTGKVDKDEKKARTKDKTDYNAFHRQMLSLKEYADERKKIPALQKENKMPVKVVAVVDTTEDDGDETSKTLTGYIRQDMGDNSVNVYEVTYDRAKKKITAVKPTADAEPGDEPTPKKSIHKKKKDDDDDADDDDTPAPKKKEKDDDN